MTNRRDSDGYALGCRVIPSRTTPGAVVFLRSGNLRPRIVLEPSDYPVAIEQHQGVTLERVKEIAVAGH